MGAGGTGLSTPGPVRRRTIADITRLVLRHMYGLSLIHI